MKSINKIIMIVIMLSSSLLIACEAPIKNAKTVTAKVYGNCGMCKKTIETAAKKSKVSKANWNKDSKIVTLTYDSTKTNLDALLKSISLAGYDNELYLAPKESYNKLEQCCQYDRPTTTKITPTTPTATTINDQVVKEDTIQTIVPTVEATTNINVENTNQLKPIYSAYFLIKDALVKDNGTLASAKAKELLTAISYVKMEKLSNDEHVVWMKVMDKLKFDAEHINETKTPSHQRDHFTTLSKYIYQLIKVSKFDTTVYYQHCPMYDNGKGANWLSTDKAIKNPYYGAQMLSCGSVQETIK
jgi:copper chaperone CopZ